jgi:peptidoglycan/LPS O-acetylase OafA/YrhL
MDGPACQIRQRPNPSTEALMPSLNRTAITMHSSDEANALAHASPAYRPEIDGLRAVAVLAVLIHHLDPAWLPGGFLGVDLFFVISGYVVTASLARRQEHHWRALLAGFYTRRFRRLIPALLVMVLITAIAFTAFVSRSEGTYDPAMGTGLSSLFGVSNLYLLSTGSSYFNFSTQFNPFLHTWSLGVEEQFYLLWPLFVLLTGVGFQGAGKRSLQVLLLLTLILSLLSFAFYWRLSTSSATAAAAFYLMPARFWELSSGALVFLVQALRTPASRPPRPGPRSSRLCWGGLSLLLVALVVTKEAALVFTPLVVVATAALLAGLSRHSPLGRALSHPSLLAIGMASYSLYLWHWPLIVVLRWTLGLRPLTIVPLLVAIALATLASYKLETRFRFGALGASWIQQPLLLYPLASLLTGGVVFALSREGGLPLYLGDPAIDPQTFAVTRAVRGTPINTRRCFLEPTAPEVASQSSDACLVRLQPQRPTLFLEGDSIAHSMLPLLERLHDAKGVNISFFGRGGCPLPWFEPWADQRHRLPRYRGCRAHAQRREAFLLSHIRPGDQLLLVMNTYARGSRSEANQQAALARLARDLERKRAGLILFAPLPVFSERTALQTPLSLCFPEWFRPLRVIPSACKPFQVNRDAALRGTRSLRDLQRRLRERHPNIHVFDPFPILCPPGQPTCSTHRQGVMLFNDGLHLTTAGAQDLFPAFDAFLQTVLPPPEEAGTR